MLEQKSLYIQQLRYRYLAYCVIRDAIGFYFGIPKFLETFNADEMQTKLLKEKVSSVKSAKSRDLTDREIIKCRRVVRRHVDKRICELETDYKNCVDVLFNDNIWLQLLDLNGEFLDGYLKALPEATKMELAVVPKWSTRDHSLGRAYINDDFNLKSIGF